MATITRRGFLEAVTAGAALAALPHASVSPALAQVKTRLSIATGGTGGVYYPVGGAIAGLISKYAPGVEATAEATAASVDNLKLLHTGNVALAMSGADIAAEASQGQLKGLRDKVGVRTVASLYANFMHVVTLESSGIRSVMELRGKRVSMGAPGSGTEIKGLRILETYGLTPKELRSHDRLSVVESVAAIKDGKIDAFFWNSALPTGAILDLASTPGLTMRLIAHPESVPKLVQKYGGFYYVGVIPRDTYKGVDADVPVAAETHALVAHERMEEPLAYQITKILLEHTAELAAVHSSTKDLTVKTAVLGSAVPFHPGAVRYYKERGVAVPA
jgi:uncharacterized protein